MGKYQDLLAYQKAFTLAVRIYETTKSFPAEDLLGMTNQVRRSSTAVCAILAESYNRRTHKKYFQYKLQEIAGENAETQVWLDMAHHLNRCTESDYHELTNLNQEVGRLVRHMFNHPEQFS